MKFHPCLNGSSSWNSVREQNIADRWEFIITKFIGENIKLQVTYVVIYTISPSSKYPPIWTRYCFAHINLWPTGLMKLSISGTKFQKFDQCRVTIYFRLTISLRLIMLLSLDQSRRIIIIIIVAVKF